jgi:hypothetical protein
VDARASGELAPRRTHHFFDALVQQQVRNAILLADNFPERNLFCKWIYYNNFLELLALDNKPEVSL